MGGDPAREGISQSPAVPTFDADDQTRGGASGALSLAVPPAVPIPRGGGPLLSNTRTRTGGPELPPDPPVEPCPRWALAPWSCRINAPFSSALLCAWAGHVAFVRWHLCSLAPRALASGDTGGRWIL